MPTRLAGVLLIPVLLATPLAGRAAAETERWSVESSKSRVAFDAFHPWGDFSGSSEGPTGEVELDIQDLKKPVKGSLIASVAALRTGDTGRDKELRRKLDGERHPDIIYRIGKVESSFASVAQNSDVLLTIHGLLTMRGTERPVTFMGRVRLSDGTLWARGESRIRPADFGVPPLRPWLIAIGEYVLARFDLVLSRSK